MGFPIFFIGNPIFYLFLHFNIRGYRMRILCISLYWGYENEFQPQMMKKTQKIMQLLNNE